MLTSYKRTAVWVRRSLCGSQAIATMICNGFVNDRKQAIPQQTAISDEHVLRVRDAQRVKGLVDTVTLV